MFKVKDTAKFQNFFQCLSGERLLNNLSFAAVVSMVMHHHKPEWHAKKKEEKREKIFAIIKVKITLWAGIIIIYF